MFPNCETTQIDWHAMMHRSIKSQHASVEFNGRCSNIFSCTVHSQTVSQMSFVCVCVLQITFYSKKSKGFFVFVGWFWGVFFGWLSIFYS